MHVAQRCLLCCIDATGILVANVGIWPDSANLENTESDSYPLFNTYFVSAIKLAVA